MRKERAHRVAAVDELPPGASKLVDVEGRSIGVFNVGGRYVAFRNVCPHEGAPVCLGTVGGTTLPSRPGVYRWGREGEILTCPWHGWEFDLVTGVSVAVPSVHLSGIRVSVNEGVLYVHVPARDQSGTHGVGRSTTGAVSGASESGPSSGSRLV